MTDRRFEPICLTLATSRTTRRRVRSLAASFFRSGGRGERFSPCSPGPKMSQIFCDRASYRPGSRVWDEGAKAALSSLASRTEARAICSTRIGSTWRR